MTRTRRSFIKLILAAASVAPFASRFAPMRPAPGFHMVNGWILTDADIVALRKFGA
jgi:hypothetical protein